MKKQIRLGENLGPLQNDLNHFLKAVREFEGALGRIGALLGAPEV